MKLPAILLATLAITAILIHPTQTVKLKSYNLKGFLNKIVPNSNKQSVIQPIQEQPEQTIEIQKSDPIWIQKYLKFEERDQELFLQINLLQKQQIQRVEQFMQEQKTVYEENQKLGDSDEQPFIYDFNIAEFQLFKNITDYEVISEDHQNFPQFVEVMNKVYMKNHLTATPQQKCDGDVIKIPIQNQIVEIGELFNIKQGDILAGQRLWSSKKDESNASIKTRTHQSTDFQIRLSERREDKFKSSHFGGGFKLKFLFFSTSKSGHSTRTERINSKEKTGSLNYQIKTQIKTVGDFSKIQFYHEQVKRSDATHVVSGLEYGAYANTVFHYKTQYYSASRDSGGFLSGAMDMVSSTMMKAGNVHLRPDQRQNLNQFTFNVDTDVDLGNNYIGTPDQAIQFMKDVPGKIIKNQKSVGKVQWAILTPVCAAIKNLDQMSQFAAAVYAKMTEATISSLNQELNQLNEIDLYFKALEEDMEKAPPIIITKSVQDKYDEQHYNYNQYSAIKKEVIDNLIYSTQANKLAQAKQLTDELSKLKTSNYNAVKTREFIDSQIDQISLLSRTIQKINDNQQIQVQIVQQNLEKEMSKFNQQNKIVLFCTLKQLLDNKDKNLHYFFGVRENLKPVKTDYLLVLYDRLTSYNKNSASYVQFYEVKDSFNQVVEKKTDDYRNFHTQQANVVLDLTKEEWNFMGDLWRQEAAKYYLNYIGDIDKHQKFKGDGSLFLGGYTSQNKAIEFGKRALLNQLIYEGQFHNDKFHGKGKIFNGGKQICEGQFENGNSKGIISCSFGEYNGQFNRFGLRQGIGRIYTNDGRVCKNEYSMGDHIKTIECCQQQGACDK